MTLTAAERATIYQAKAITRRLTKERNREASQARAERAKAVRAAQIASGGELAAQQRQARVLDPTYLKWLRRAPCVAGAIEGGCDGAVQAAHLRMSVAGRQNPGMGRKADDRFCTPLCGRHHIHDQHTGSEAAFWGRLGIDPFALCNALHSGFTSGLEPEQAVRSALTSKPRS